MSNEEYKTLNIKVFLFDEEEKKEGVDKMFFTHLKLLQSSPNVFETIKTMFEELIKALKINFTPHKITLEKIEQSYNEIIKKKQKDIEMKLF